MLAHPLSSSPLTCLQHSTLSTTVYFSTGYITASDSLTPLSTGSTRILPTGQSTSPLEMQDQGHTLSPVGSLKGQSLAPPSSHMLPLGQIISRFGDSFHSYADDPQLYIKMDTRPSATLLLPSPLSIITTCLEKIKAWMKHNFLQLNSSKTEVILVGTLHKIQSSSITNIMFSGQVIPLSTSVTNLGVSTKSNSQSSVLTPRNSSMPLSPPGWITAAKPLNPEQKHPKAPVCAKERCKDQWWS